MPAADDAPCKVLYFTVGNEALYALIRETMPPGYELVTLETGSEEERLSKLADCEAVIVSSQGFTRAHADAARRLRLVHHQGVGYHDTLDLDALRDRQLPLAVTPGGTSTGVAEHTIMLMTAVAKRLAFVDAELRAGRWHANTLRDVARQIEGMTIGILGLGRVGRGVARRLLGWGVTVIYTDIAEIPPEVERELAVSRVALDELLARSDVVTLHVPLTRATRHIIDAGALARMKRGAMLINCARGPVVDEAALVEALAGGHLAGAGLDVFEVEPLQAGSPLVDFPNVVLTPHMAAGTRDAMRQKLTDVFANIDRFRRGEPLVDRVDLSAEL